jgi:hypothetical protein
VTVESRDGHTSHRTIKEVTLKKVQSSEEEVATRNHEEGALEGVA